MATEIETKVLNINKEDIVRKLTKLNAQKIFDDELKYDIFGIDEQMPPEPFVRVRKEGDKVILAYKKRLDNKKVKECEEIEVEVSDYDKTYSILEKAGLLPRFKLKKHRTSFKFDDAQIDIDTYDIFPTFLEIEAESEEIINKYIELLELKDHKIGPFVLTDLEKIYNIKMT